MADHKHPDLATDTRVDRLKTTLLAADDALDARVAALEARTLADIGLYAWADGTVHDRPPTEPPPTEPPPTGRTDPRWAIDTRASFDVPSTTDTVLSGPQTTASIKAAISGLGNGTPAVWKLLRITGQVTLSGDQSGIGFTSRSYVVLDLTGAVISWSGQKTGNLESALYFINSHHIKVRGGSFTGAQPSGQVQRPDHTEYQCAAAVRTGSHHIELDGVSWDGIPGFGILTTSAGGAATIWPEDIWVHDCTLRGAQQTFAVVCGRRLLYERNSILDDDGSPIDLEPDLVGHGIEDVLIQDNTFRRFGYSGGRTGGTAWWLAANANNGIPVAQHPSVVMSRVTVRDNRIPEGHVDFGGNNSGEGGLLIRMTKTNPKRDFVITGNISDDDSPSSVTCIFNAMEGLTLTDNRQVLAGHGPLYRHDPFGSPDVPDTGLVVTPNVT